jgi:hypothetical protein
LLRFSGSSIGQIIIEIILNIWSFSIIMLLAMVTLKKLLLPGLIYFVVRGAWSWKDFVHKSSLTLIENIGLLLVETITFQVCYFIIIPKFRGKPSA